MKLLFSIDRKDYSDDLVVNERFCVRALIYHNGMIAVQKSSDGECKLLGGGVEPNEDFNDALIREVREEAGLTVSPESICPIGEVIQKYRDIFNPDAVYYCHTYFYSCSITGERTDASPSASEKKKGFHLCWMPMKVFLKQNSSFLSYEWIARDTKFIEYMVKSGYEESYL